MSKLLAMVLAVLVGLSTIPVAFADSMAPEGTITVQYVQINAIKATLSISSSGLAQCNGVIKPKSSGDSSSITITLQRKSGTSWVYVASWSGTGSGISGASASGSKSISSGTYRVVANGKVGSEPASATSSTRTY